MNKIISLFSDDPKTTDHQIREVLRAGYNQPIVFSNHNDHSKHTKQYRTLEASNVEEAQQLTIKHFGKRADFAVWDDPIEEPLNDPPPETVAVVVTCHNYGHFLSGCLESILGQSVEPLEVIVVDDASTDNTKRVTESFDGVNYLRVNHRNPLLSRRDGVQNTKSDVVLFVDADDTLPADYIECGMREFTDKTVGVVYADHQHFGDGERQSNFPNYTQDRLFSGPNFVGTCSLIRREALLICDVWNRCIDISELAEDYFLYQRISLDGWKFKKQKAVLNYRRHSIQRSKSFEHTYYEWHGLNQQEVTLFIPLAGRKWGWDRLSEFLDLQTWPHDQIKLVLCDTSQDAEFTQMVSDWIAVSDYADVSHFQLDAGIPGLADKDRKENSQLVKYAVCRIYNQLRLKLETPYCWILEDDIIPPDDVLERLLKSFDKDVGAVTAPFQSRYCGMPTIWDQNNKLLKPQTGVTEVGGSGFGCVVTRKELIKKHLWPIQSPEQDLDPYFFQAFGDEWRVLCDWSCKAEHWEEDQVYLIGGSNVDS